MLDIYICEDEIQHLKKIQRSIENYITFEDLDIRFVAAVQTPEAMILQAQKAENPGLYFLDIEFKGSSMNGLKLAQELRKIEPRCFIVFITSHFEFSIETYRYKVEALDFIQKTDLEQVDKKIRDCIQNAYTKHIGGNNTFRDTFNAVMPDKHRIAIKYDEIFYFKTSRIPHRVTVVSKRKYMEFPGQLSTLETVLPEYFFRCHRDTIVNMKNVVDVDYVTGEIKFKGTDPCHFSLRKGRELKKLMKQKNFRN